MKHHYSDIRSRIAAPPVFWDEHGVPRYVPFSPEHLADLYADECALLEIACQLCGERFDVAVSRSGMADGVQAILKKQEPPPTLAERITTKTLGYGDPPNTGCCPGGACTSSDSVRVREYWRRSDPQYVKNGIVVDRRYFDWVRNPDLERSLTE